MSSLHIGAVYRYSSSFDPGKEFVDGLSNLLFCTRTWGLKKVLLEAGINPIGKVSSIDGSSRTPAILIRSSINKHGKKESPWRDEFVADRGFIRYFGDNKSSRSPDLAPGNRVILDQFQLHHGVNRNLRLEAVPLLFFKSVKVGSREKGNLRFEGLGLLSRAELVTQYQSDIGYFTNFLFQFDVLDISQENESLNWQWISDRRNPEFDSERCLRFAPKSWKTWVDKGDRSRQSILRKVIKYKVVKKSEQLPDESSIDSKFLLEIYSFYHGKKHHFELLAAKVISSILRSEGARYEEGWITKRSGDGGVDFVGKLMVGSAVARTEIVVLGQAKCEDPNKPTSGLHIARTVARLRRGWIGAFVTTSFFSEPSQLEILDDKYPLIMVNGKVLSLETRKLMDQAGASDLRKFLQSLELQYEGSISERRPEEILG